MGFVYAAARLSRSSLDLRAHFCDSFAMRLPARIHFAAHSHHYWPDVAVRAHEQPPADDAARLADRQVGA